MSLFEDDFEIENEEEELNDSDSEQALTTSEHFNSVEDKVQDDFDLIALVEGNPRLYSKGNSGYRNVYEKDMAWISIGRSLKNPQSGSEAKHRWDTLRNLYGRGRREILALQKQQGLSGSGRDNISYEHLLTPQSKAIHRFMGKLYIPRKTVSNYVSSLSSASCSSQPSLASKSRLPFKSNATSFSPISASEGSTIHPLKNLSTPSSTWKHNVIKNIPDNNQSLDDTTSECSLKVPKSDIRKRKKADLETESLIKESSQAITATCSALPALLNTASKTGTTEEEGIVTIILNGLKRVPSQEKTRCLIKVLEILESYQK